MITGVLVYLARSLISERHSNPSIIGIFKSKNITFGLSIVSDIKSAIKSTPLLNSKILDGIGISRNASEKKVLSSLSSSAR